ncbi:MAG TPA: pyridoxamine 5'-phosphate oxidase family protein [Clostridium sp.]
MFTACIIINLNNSISTVSEEGYSYTVPLSYVYYDNCIYFHSAKDGNKLKNIAQNNKVWFCVVTYAEVLQSEFSTKYKI